MFRGLVRYLWAPALIERTAESRVGSAVTMTIAASGCSFLSGAISSVPGISGSSISSSTTFKDFSRAAAIASFAVPTARTSNPPFLNIADRRLRAPVSLSTIRIVGFPFIVFPGLTASCALFIAPHPRDRETFSSTNRVFSEFSSQPTLEQVSGFIQADSSAKENTPPFRPSPSSGPVFYRRNDPAVPTYRFSTAVSVEYSLFP